MYIAYECSTKLKRYAKVFKIYFDCRNLPASLSHGCTANLSKQQKG